VNRLVIAAVASLTLWNTGALAQDPGTSEGEAPAVEPEDPDAAGQDPAVEPEDPDAAGQDPAVEPEDPDAAGQDPAVEPDEPPDPGGDDEGGVIETTDSPSLIDLCRKAAESRALTVVPPAQKYPFIEWHGYFRLRADMFTDADLETYAPAGPTDFVATSLFLPPLLHNAVNSSGEASFSDDLDGETEQTIGTANMRLRLSPVVRVAGSLRIGTTIDILDNVVLGSTPEYRSTRINPAVPLDTLTATQVPPTSGLNSVSDSFMVKEAWAEWDIGLDQEPRPGAFTLGTLKVGRYAQPWGLGIWTSAGDYPRDDTSLSTIDRARALDMDGGNYLDRISWRYDFGMFKLLAGYGMLASGPTSRVQYDTSLQPYDIEEKDDVRQVELAVYSRPDTRQDFLARRKGMFTGRPILDWGLYVTLRTQDMATTLSGQPDPLVLDYVDSYSKLELVDRSAWLATPDLWLRLDWRPDPETRFYAALEGVYVIGSVEHPTGTPGEDSLDISQYGVALETDVTLGAVSFGMDWGLASGDDGEMMGVFTGKDVPWGSDNVLSAYSFNRNYIVDLLLYREVVGSVTNSTYFRPHFAFDIIPTEENAFGGAIAAMYALTMEPDAYSGNSRNLGLEFDFSMFYEEANRFLTSVAFGMMFPFAALDRPEKFLGYEVGARESAWAWTLQGNLTLVY